ncbi:hypothetical protein JR316_0001825 [Psilocybe cubensis]|uniref:N-acetyltransferase domain-containing protein n=2 Tax=Psilocybe cubensis TaxID=181762 RepID=A0A8H7Y2H2_PSICU|nr:hypothetical protein JR316_0001825 [Psilocybe cubensis]KAH9484923.1 hypothetical protein JR316_0001825 [Psilocybe cubensis]
MAFVNNYRPPTPPKLDLSLNKDKPYSINCNIDLPKVLETDRVQLVPFIPSLHAESVYETISSNPQIERFLPISWPTLESFLTFIETFIRQQYDTALFTIIDKTRTPASGPNNHVTNGRIAGLIGWLHASPQNLSVEIGPVIVFPEFQRTFVSANAIGLLLRFFLDLPAQGGQGFRRVVWCASPANEASIAAAEKMQFVKEGVTRWLWILPEGKEGGRPVDGTRGAGPGRDSVVLSLCWDDWEAHARDEVTKRMERV